MKLWLLLASAFGFTAVAAGAFGAHALRQKLEPRDLEIFETAVRYQMWHALALVGVAWAATQPRLAAAGASRAGWAFTAGILVFSGSLYLLVLTQTRWLGAITPIGGLSFLAGWALLFWASLRS